MTEGKGAAAAAWMLLLASLLLLALSPSPSDGLENDEPSEISSSDEQRRLDSRRIRDVGGVWLPVELQQLAEDEIRHEAQKPRRKHRRRSQHNAGSPEEEERRRRLWEQQERRRVDEERRRAHEPPRPEEPPQPTTRRPTYEERLREWQRQKEEHDRLVREREKEYEALTVRPLGPSVQQSAPSNVQRAPPGSLTEENEENERKLQDYIERNTPINAPGRGQLMAHSRPPSSRQPWGAGRQDPYESHEQRGHPAYDYNEPERGYVHEGSSGAGERQQQQQLTPEDERQIAEYHERLETQLAQLQGPARQEFERQARQREDEYRRRLQQDHLREKTGCNQTSSQGQAQRRPPPASSSSVKGAVVDPCASGPYPPYGDARYANRGPDGRPCPPPPPAAPARSRGETKGPSNDQDPYEQYRRAQESRYRPEQSKGPQPDNQYEEQRRAAEARWRAEQNKGPVVDPYAELRRADEARYLAQQNKGPAPYEDSRRAQEEARYRAEQSKGVVTPPPAARHEQQQQQQQQPPEPDWRRYEEMRRAEDSTRIQPAASKGGFSGRPNDGRQETLQPEVWNRVYQASYHRAGDPAESSTHSGRDSSQEQPTRPQRPQSAGSPSSRYGSHPTAVRPNHSDDDDNDDDQAGSMSNVRYEEHRRNEAVVAPGTNPVKHQPELGRQQQQQHNANQTAAAAAAHSTTGSRPPATSPVQARNATTENHAPNALQRNDNAIDFMRGLRPDRPGPVASNFPAPMTPRPAAAKSPSACVWAVVVCCRVQRDPQKLVRCFEAINCPDGNWDEGRCAPPIVGAANHEVGQFYRGSAAAARTTTTAQR